ncbi:hypothetical protein RHSIM_Rhsim10G0050700 [Rhododendron simsii]|uniref:Uncharacterized protein n=1 Tax=Rhododendron simsii TaxID=118357 RepID=A0A834L942_RHOSS|nr:hypothetical protein RHSIM_Rhsim10G0050700 [Rhododendron simsii]
MIMGLQEFFPSKLLEAFKHYPKVDFNKINNTSLGLTKCGFPKLLEPERTLPICSDHCVELDEEGPTQQKHETEAFASLFASGLEYHQVRGKLRD